MEQKKKKIGEVRLVDRTTGMEFDNIVAAAKHFNCSKATIVKYAKGQAKLPNFSFKLEFLEEFRQNSKGPRL